MMSTQCASFKTQNPYCSKSRYCSVSESKSFHDPLDESSNDLNGCGDYDIIPDSLALETETERRHRLDSFYSATSVKSTYFSAGSVSSYHSIDDDNSTDIGTLLTEKQRHDVCNVNCRFLELRITCINKSAILKGTESINNSQIMYGPSSTLPALTTQLSNSWTTVQGKIIT